MEDVRGGHTTNPVPVLAIGPGREDFIGARSITEVTPRILNAIGIEGNAGS